MIVGYSLKMSQAFSRAVSLLVRDLKGQRSLEFFLVFLAFFLSSKFGQQFFITFQTSPAIIWPSAGIGLAAVLLRGYKMWVPIAAASFLATATSPTAQPLIVILGATIGQTIMLVVGAYALHKLNFINTFETIRDVIVFCVGILFISMIAPTVITASQGMAGTLSDGIYVSWSRGWAGRVLSMLVLTPLLITWLSWRPREKSGRQILEKSLAILLLGASIYLLFWTPLAQNLSFIALLMMMLALFWMALRMNFRTMSLALFLIAAFGIWGAVSVPNAAETPLNLRLFSIELFIILIAPIFYLFTALVKQHRMALAISRRRSDELETAMSKLEELDRQKDTFISTLAHELRNPLGAILHSLEFLQMEGLPSDERKEPLGIAVRQSRQIDKMLKNLLDTSRAQQGKIALEREDIYAATIVKRAVETSKPLLKKGKQQFTMEMPGSGLRINCDPLRVEQILVNLLSNAIKYTEKGGKIILSVFPENGWAVFRVKDTGRGLARDTIDRVFDLFVQVNQNNEIQGGLGIGLTLSRILAELHGGTLTAESSGLGKGSEFTLRIPVEKDTEMSKEQKKQKEKSPVLPKRRRILVVDDNADLVNVFKKILTALGQDVHAVLESRQVLAEALSWKPDIIFLDLGMPEKDGYELAREIRAEKKLDKAKLIALSGYGQPEDKSKSQKSGFDAHIVKPVSIEELKELLISGIKND